MKNLLFAVIIIFLLAVSAPALDLQVMQTAVRVQERILDTIIDADTSFRVDTHSEGIYLSGLGAVFSLKISEEFASSLLSILHNFPELQMQLSVNEYEKALKDASDKLQDVFDDKVDYDKIQRRDELKNQLNYIQQQRQDTQRKLNDPGISKNETELRRQDLDLKKVEEELSNELKNLEESVARFEAAIQASQKAVRGSASVKTETRAKSSSKSVAGSAASGREFSADKELERRQERLRYFSQNVGRMMEKLKGYIADYGPALNLPPEEMLMLRVEFLSFTITDDALTQYEITAPGNLLSGLRSGKIERAKFIDRLTVRESAGKSSAPSDIVILKNILNTVFEQDFRSDFNFRIVDKESFWETYIPGYGAVFFRKYNPGAGLVKIDISGQDEARIVISGEGKSSISKIISDDSKTKSLPQLQDELTDLMVDYSATLKSLKPGEQVVIALKLVSGISKEKVETLVMKLKKSDIDRYRNSPELKSKIEVVKI